MWKWCLNRKIRDEHHHFHRRIQFTSYRRNLMALFVNLSATLNHIDECADDLDQSICEFAQWNATLLICQSMWRATVWSVCFRQVWRIFPTETMSRHSEMAFSTRKSICKHSTWLQLEQVFAYDFHILHIRWTHSMVAITHTLHVLHRLSTICAWERSTMRDVKCCRPVSWMRY